MAEREYDESLIIFERVEKLRAEKGWTTYKLAKKAGVSVNALYHWRDRRSSPTLYLLQCLSIALEVPLTYLVFDRDKIENLSNEQKMLIERWNRLKHKEKISIMSVLDAFEENKK